MTSKPKYVPILTWPPIEGDSINTPFVVGEKVDQALSPHERLDGRNLPHFDPKNDLSERRPEPANDTGKGVDTLSRSPHISDISVMWEIAGKYKRFVPVAQVFASMSKMPGTKVGCVVLGDAMQVLSSGWNGAPRGSDADAPIDRRLESRQSRLDWTCHAEANAVANAARTGVSLDGGVLICTLMPCMTCAKLIVQAGIVLVLCPEPTDDDERWKREFDLTRSLFSECDIDIIHYDQEHK